MQITPTTALNYRLLEEAQHPVLDVLYPRKLVNLPPDYWPPKYFPTMVADAMENLAMGNFADQTKNAIYLTACKLAKFRVPTYAVDYNFLHAIIRSKPPANYLLKDLKWPFEAMLFLIPEQFGIDYIGKPILFIGAMVYAKEEVFKCPCPVLGGKEIQEVMGANTNAPGKGCLDIVANVLEPATDNSEMLTAAYSSVTRMEDATMVADCMEVLPVRFYGQGLRFGGSGKMRFDEAEDTKINARLTTLGLQLILAMGAVPQFVTLGRQVAKARPPQNGKTGGGRKALYEPNYIGKGFAPAREKVASLGGTHASPAMHWREGHWRRQHFGEGNKQEKIIWIQPVLVNAPE